MRISDWSSDVCSSDLVAEIEQVAGHYDDIWLRDTGPILTRDEAIVCRFNGWGGRVREWRRDVEVGMQIARLAQRPVTLLDCVVEGGALEFDGLRIMSTRSNLLDPRRNRSEEHTSELQSLMRISYAVFCLKKKKKKQQTT